MVIDIEKLGNDLFAKGWGTEEIKLIQGILRKSKKVEDIQAYKLTLELE